MAALLYRQHLIIATEQYDRANGVWLSIVDVSWGSGPYRGSHVITDPARSFPTSADAEFFGIETGQTWVDERLKTASVPLTADRYGLANDMVKLRDHPLLSYRNVPSWPPKWVWIGGAEDKQPQGEIGILMRVTASQQAALNNRCFLWIEYAEGTYIGCLLVNDCSFLRRLSNLLQENCGHSIEAIGSLDLSYLG